MPRTVAACVRLFVAAIMIGTTLSGLTGASAADLTSPVSAAETVRNQLFLAQGALLGDESNDAVSAVGSARDAADILLAGFGADSPAGFSLSAALSAADSAAGANDPIGLAAARGQVWTAILAGAMETTITSVQSGDLAAARSWLLVREYRESTKFSRPGADATLAIRDLDQGTISIDQAVAAVRADLLDTYQANFESILALTTDTISAGMASRAAESSGLISGYWAILAPSYEAQFGIDQRSQLDRSIETLVTAVQTSDSAAVLTSLTPVSTAFELFRAAPLSVEEQARRAGQLLLYLSLIPVEYGRGVKEGQVTSDIEIQEAQSFYEGAQAAFNDLRLTLNTQDPAKTAEVASVLAMLQAEIHAASLHQTVSDPSEIKRASESASATLKSLFPSEWERPGGDADFDVIRSLLDEMEKAVAAKQFPQAESARLEAYAIFEAGPEKRLMGFSPKLSQEVEALFWQGTSKQPGLSTLISQKSSSGDLRETRLTLDSTLAEAQTSLGAGRPADGAIIFNAATIVFREGLEAVLILVSLMASMVGVNRRFKKPLAVGAAGALLASAALFMVARSLLASLSRYGEKLEAIVSLIAIGVLLLVMNWFFHKVYWTKWIAGHHAKRRAIIGGAAGQMAGLVVLGFTSVFREGGETVLFLQALVLDAGTAVVIEGVLLGLAGVAVVGVLVFAMQKKLPHKKMLIVTGVMIALVLVVMVGNTVHVLQVVGWAPITPVSGAQFPYWAGVWFGIYATWESLIAQAIALVFVIGSYYLAEMQHDRALARMTRTVQQQPTSQLA